MGKEIVIYVYNPNDKNNMMEFKNTIQSGENKLTVLWLYGKYDMSNLFLFSNLPQGNLP